MIKRFINVVGWSFLWFIFFWAFLIIHFPAESAKDWLADRLEKGLKAMVSIEGLHVRWDLGMKLKGVSIDSSHARPGGGESGDGGGFILKLSTVNIDPGLFSLIRVRPELEFDGDTPSGGFFSGSYEAGELSISFKDVSFKDLSISTIPVPSTATVNGSGKFKFIKGKGMIDIEVDGIPGGRQRIKAGGGEGAGLDGRLKIAVSLPKL